MKIERSVILVTGENRGLDAGVAAGVDMAKTSPFQMKDRTLNGVEEGLAEVLADDTSAFVKNSLPNHIETFYPKVAAPRL